MSARAWIALVAASVAVAGPAAGAETVPVRRGSQAGTVAVVFVGDIMLDNGPGHAVASGRDPFADCAELLLDGDFTVGNLECVLGKGGRQVLKAYSFRAATDSPRHLRRYFSVLSVANNHALDFEADGLVECLRILAAEGIRQVGGGRTLAEARRPLVLEKDGIRIAIVAANGFHPEESAAGEATPGVAPLEEAAILADIAAARKEADFVVPFLHWGPELVAQPREADRELARKMVDAGAAAVIGGHPHVTQTVDVHAGAPIVYSLGNFVFDYYPVDPPLWTGWVARLSFVKGGPVTLETKTVVLDAAGLPRPAGEED